MGAIAFYSVVGTTFTVVLVVTMIQHPLFPLQLESAAWASSWLITTCVDYAAAAVCLCGIVLATESTLAGLLWSFAMLCLGSVFSCSYLVYRAMTHQSLSLGTAQ